MHLQCNAFFKRRGLLNYLLWPLSCVFGLLVRVRQTLYRFNVLKATKLPVPVIVVGNIIVGGTGKTSVVRVLAQYLHDNGFKPGIVARGYGAASPIKQPILITATHTPQQVGDEALMLAEQTHLPVVVCADRVAAAQHLLVHCDVNIILSDDGLQHYKLSRDIEIIALDSNSPIGNGFLLPSGPLRETPARLASADYIIQKTYEGSTLNRSVNRFIRANAPVFAMQYTHPSFAWLGTGEEITLETLKRFQHIVAVTGIAQPDTFFDVLRTQRLIFESKYFPDHHLFTAEDLNFPKANALIMTEKDAIKCKNFPNKNMVICRITPQISSDFFTHIPQCLNAL